MDENNVMAEVTSLIRSWEEENHNSNYDPTPPLKRLAEIIEAETENYMKMDPDPFDERHPSRTDPDCKLGQILKLLFRKDNFMNRLVNDYLRDNYYSRLGLVGDINQLNIAACRLMLDVMPGLETSVVFQLLTQPEMDGLIHRLIKWTTESVEPLQSYATGLLAAAMEIPDIANKFREQNFRLVPLLLNRLKDLQSESDFAQHKLEKIESSPSHTENPTISRPFAHLNNISSPFRISEQGVQFRRRKENGNVTSLKRTASLMSPDRADCDSPITLSKDESSAVSESDSEQKHKRLKADNEGWVSKHNVPNSPSRPTLMTETSNSSWVEMESFVIGNIQMYPPNLITRQIFILRYLHPLGEYQEFLSHVFENNALELILTYVNVRETKEARLAFEALKYLAALLCHKKFCIEFIHCKGLEALLEVPRPSIAATGVSICLYYLGYCEEAMERICLFPKYIVSSLVHYALWLLECSHDSGRCHATMFFGSTFQFKVILDEFDAQDGLRKLHNVISTLPILQSESNPQHLNEDAECAARQIVRHVCLAYKRYLEAHLYIKVEHIRRAQMRPSDRHTQAIATLPSYKACKSSPEEVQEQIDTLIQHMPFRAHWTAVDQLLKLGGIMLLLKVIAFAYEWNYSGRAETVRHALDVLAIACVIPKVQLLFCERVDLPEESITYGINIILGAAEGEIVADADVQKAALRVLVNCVCAPIHRVGGTVARYSSTASTNSPSKKTKLKSSEELIQKVWESVRGNCGIMVLLQLMNVKTPITDADTIRTLACKALAGLARSETVRQILSKLPMFTNGQLQNLMRDPILQEKRQEHVTFQKYALELLQRLSGNWKKTGHDLDASLVNIFKAKVVAQTKIHFNDRQLLQLIHQHLVFKGYSETATMLQKEANLASSLTSVNMPPPAKFSYTSPGPSSRGRMPFQSPLIRSLSTSSVTLAEGSSTSGVSSSSNSPAIKLIKKLHPPPASPPVENSRLQKQIYGESHLKLAKPGQNFGEQSTPEPRVTLDSIITEYLTNQHALCKNPTATCPPFDLFLPHKCPDPKPRIAAANNFVIRCARRAIGYQCKPMDRKFIHSRFCPVQTIRPATDDGFFSCAQFMPGDRSIVVGEYSGEVRLFNLHSGNEESVFQAHDNYIVHLEPNRTGTLLLTSSTWGRRISALWGVNVWDMKLSLADEEYVEFSHVAQDRILGTKAETASIYDVNTGQLIMRLNPTISNQYTKNRATFSHNDELVLSDGVLYDVASGKQIHKLDKLNQTQSGVFHPNGLEIVSNTEVWDIRTFHLLKTVPVLNQCQVTFSPVNSAIYAIALEQDLDDEAAFDSSFKTVDAVDYSSIATIDVKKKIYTLAVNRYDTQIALVENQGVYQSAQESVVRIYDVGRKRDDEDEQDDDDEEDEMDGSDDDNSDNDGPLLLDLTADLRNDENGGNNGNEEGGNQNDRSSSDYSWSSISEDSDDSYESDSSGLSAMEDLLFEY